MKYYLIITEQNKWSLRVQIYFILTRDHKLGLAHTVVMLSGVALMGPVGGPYIIGELHLELDNGLLQLAFAM